MSLADLPGVPASALSAGTLAALPAATPAPPWRTEVEATLWWHRAAPDARDLLPPALRDLPAVALTVGAVVRYRSSPVGPYSEVIGSPLLLRHRGLRVHLPFLAVDSVASVHGGRAHWGLPKVLATFGADRVAGQGWSLAWQARPLPLLPALPVLAVLPALHLLPGRTMGPPARSLTTVAGRLRPARVEVACEGLGLPDWLLAGRHRGAAGHARLRVGRPRG